MSKKNILLFFTLIGLLIFSGAYIAGGVQAYARFQQDSLQRQEHCGGQAPVQICIRAPKAVFSAFYPFYLSTQYPLFNVIYSSQTPLTLLISASLNRFSEVQTRTVNATNVAQSSAFIPTLSGNNILQKLTTEENTQLHVQVMDTGNRLYYRDDIPVVLHSRWLMQWITAYRLNIGAWVTPNDPAIAALVVKASEHLSDQPPPTTSAMIGYRHASAQQVIAQVDAVYDALRLDYHIRYVQTSIPYNATNDNNAMQVIKLPNEVLQQRSGMCIEMTVLLASALEHIGLRTEIVIIPGHAFLGVSVTEDGRNQQYWDASDINNNVAADSANVQANHLYAQNLKQRSILDIITLSDARKAHIGPML